MDGYSIAFGLGGLLVGGIASTAAVLAWLHARKTLAFEKQKWEESKNPDVKVELIFPELSTSMGLTAVNQGIPPVTLKFVGFWVGDMEDFIMLVPPDHQLIKLPQKLERWDEHSITLHASLVASILKDDNQYGESVELSVCFMDTMRQTYSSAAIVFDIDKWYAEPSTAAEPEAGDKSRRSLFGVGRAVVDILK